MRRKMLAWWTILCLLPVFCFGAQQALAEADDDPVVGIWAISQVAFAYVDTGVGGIDASFTVDEEARQAEEWILRFESGGGFSSGFSFVHDQYYAGESLNFTQYSGWALDEAGAAEADAVVSGRLDFSPFVEGFGYSLSLSADDTLTLTVTEVYFKQSETTSMGFTTKSGEVPMTYTITLVRATGALLPAEDVAEAEQAPEIASANIDRLQAEGVIGVTVTGKSISNTNVSITNKTDQPVTVLIEPGTWFESSSRSVQNMLVRASRKVELSANESSTISIPTACMNIARDIPGASNSFSVNYDPSSRLAKLVAYADEHGCSYEVMQCAVWIVTDGVDDAALRTSLVDQSGSAVITQTHIDEARGILRGL